MPHDYAQSAYHADLLQAAEAHDDLTLGHTELPANFRVGMCYQRQTWLNRGQQPPIGAINDR
jgi:hypothetical protein